jgi:hypothetical protein
MIEAGYFVPALLAEAEEIVTNRNLSSMNVCKNSPLTTYLLRSILHALAKSRKNFIVWDMQEIKKTLTFSFSLGISHELKPRENKIAKAQKVSHSADIS